MGTLQSPRLESAVCVGVAHQVAGAMSLMP